MFAKIMSVFKKKPEVVPRDTRIYSQAQYSPSILDQETPIIPGVFPLEGQSIGKDEKFNPGVAVLKQPDPGK